MAHYICGLAGEADAEQQRKTPRMMPKILPNVASGLLKACRPMKMGEMEKGDRPPGWQSIISINSFIELIASGSECSRNEASAGSPHFFPLFFIHFSFLRLS